MANKSNQELQADVKVLESKLEQLLKQLETVSRERDEAREQVTEAVKKIQQNPTAKPTTDGHNVSKQELRMLTAMCLPSTKDPSGRAHNTPTIEKEAPGLVSVAVRLASEIVSQIP